MLASTLDHMHASTIHVTSPWQTSCTLRESRHPLRFLFVRIITSTAPGPNLLALIVESSNAVIAVGAFQCYCHFYPVRFVDVVVFVVFPVYLFPCSYSDDGDASPLALALVHRLLTIS